MKLEEGRITNAEFTLLIIGFTLGSSVIIPPGSSAGKDGWLAILAGLGESYIFIFIFMTLAIRFPGKTLIEINDIIFGPLMGKLISLGYLGYFLHLASLVLRNFGDFVVLNIFHSTPMLIVLGLNILIAASAVRNGIEVIGRISCILVPIIIATFFFNTLLLANKMDFTRLLPFFDLPITQFLKAGHEAASFPFGETVAFLMIAAFVSNNVTKTKKSALLGVTVAALLLALASVRNAAVLGITDQLSTYPSYSAMRLVNIFDILTRVEILIAASFYFMGFFKFSILYYGTVVGTAQLLNLRTYLPLVLPTGIIITFLTLIQFNSVIENIYFALEVYPFYSLPFQILLPALSLLIAVIRGLPKKASNMV